MSREALPLLEPPCAVRLSSPAGRLPTINRVRITLVLLSLLAALSLGAAQASAACTPKANLEAIVDDSTSMALSDPYRLRLRAMELLIDTQGNEARTLAAVEFGSEARAVFAPGVIGTSGAAFKAAMAAALVADGGGTDYNAGFAAASAQNPFANARIFLTDGQHTGYQPYADRHAGGPPVYVIGLGIGFADSPADLLLRRIAKETGGVYRRVDEAGQLQPAMFDVDSVIACMVNPKRFADRFRRTGRPSVHAVTIPSGTRAAQFALTWTNSADSFTVGDFRVLRRGRLSKVRGLKVSRRRGPTFTAVKVSGAIAGKLRFAVKAAKLAKPGRAVELTTQVTRRARR